MQPPAQLSWREPRQQHNRARVWLPVRDRPGVPAAVRRGTWQRSIDSITLHRLRGTAGADRPGPGGRHTRVLTSSITARAASVRRHAASRPWRRAPIVACTVLLALALAPAAKGAEDETPGPSYVLTGWAAHDGAPDGDIWSMAQDASGFLWLGTTRGLVRFDGFEFVRWDDIGSAPLPGGLVRAVLHGRDGSLWMGFADTAGVARLLDGRLTLYTRADGLPANVLALAEDASGTIWAGGRGGIARFSDEQWQAFDLHGADVYSLYIDRRQTIWAGTATGTHRLSPGTTAFHTIAGSPDFVQSFAEDRAGTVWVTDTERIVSSLTPAQRPGLAAPVRLPAAGWRLLRDAEGDVWIAALGSGLLRLHPGSAGRPVIERVVYERTLPGAPRSLFQDRDRNIWVGMRGGGLLRLSEPVVRMDTRLEGVTNDGVRALTLGPGGRVWAATGHNVNVLGSDRHEAYPITQTMALHADRDGRVWAATHEGIGAIEGGRFRALRLPREVRLEQITSLTRDAAGTLWICSVEEGTLRLAAGEITNFAGTEVGGRPCGVSFADSRGRVWLGFTRGGVAVHDDGRFRQFGDGDGLAPGGVLAIHEDAAGAIWIATATGLTRVIGDRLVTADARNGLPADIGSSLVDDGDGHIWLGTDSGAGLIRLNAGEMDRVAAERSHRIEYAIYDASDGLQGVLHWRSRPSAVRDAGGYLWFLTGTGISVVDPRRLPAPRTPAGPVVERVTVDGTVHRHPGHLELPPGTSSIQVDYTTLALSGSSKLRFRHRLEGLNSEWVDAGRRRTASYTNLPPGHYRFQVAATGDGSWPDEEPTAWAFTLHPPFYRTTPFYASCALALALVGWLLWSLRVRAIRRQFTLVLEERARVSREIHDSLLQDLGGIRLKLEALTSQVGGDHPPIGTALQTLHRQVGRCIREARHSIWELRFPRRDARDLPAGLEGLAGDLRLTDGRTVHVSVHGTPRRCTAEVEEQLLRIAQEALGNAVRHGRSATIGLEVEYTDDTVTLRVVDDGVGFEPDAAAATDDRHWGLVNMRERALSIGARLHITSRPGAGTRVDVSAPLAPVRQG